MIVERTPVTVRHSLRSTTTRTSCHCSLLAGGSSPVASGSNAVMSFAPRESAKSRAIRCNSASGVAGGAIATANERRRVSMYLLICGERRPYHAGGGAAALAGRRDRGEVSAGRRHGGDGHPARPVPLVPGADDLAVVAGNLDEVLVHGASRGRAPGEHLAVAADDALEDLVAAGVVVRRINFIRVEGLRGGVERRVQTGEQCDDKGDDDESAEHGSFLSSLRLKNVRRRLEATAAGKPSTRCAEEGVGGARSEDNGPRYGIHDRARDVHVCVHLPLVIHVGGEGDRV